MRFPILEPEIAYYDDWLWIPKHLISLQSQKSSLEIPQDRGEDIRMWREGPHHLGVPRALIAPEQVRCPVVDLTPCFETVDISSRITLDHLDPSKTTQRDAFRDLAAARGGILNLACGAGKTVIMLHAVAHWGRPTLVIANQEEILDQWRGEIEEFLSFDGGIGWVQGGPEKWDWRRPITLGMIRSLARYSTEVPPEMRNYFGSIIWDEVHHLAAPEFCKTADLFNGHRYGATATVERSDGNEIAYLWHLGGVLHSNLDQDLMPVVKFLRSPTRVDTRARDVREYIEDVSGSIHARKLRAYVGCREEELDFLVRELRFALDAGRKILALSLSKDQLNALHERFPGSGLITGDVKGVDARRRALRETRICFGTTDLAREALNDRALDALFLLTEFSSEGMLQQSVGRIQRIMDGKKDPVVVIIRHHHIKQLERSAQTMMAYFRRNSFNVEAL
jgi:superfamily II DNA or RNA helicase